MSTEQLNDFSAAQLQSSPGTIAVLIACYNEEPTVAQVVDQFRAELPSAKVYVFDNNSSDRTAEEARRAGAIVLSERRQGKGYVVQAMFTNAGGSRFV